MSLFIRIRCLALRGAWVALACILWTGPLQADTEAIGVVTGQTGFATVLRDAVPAPLLLGDSIYRGDRVVTGPETRISIAFDDRSTVAIGPQSSVAISTVITADDGSITECILDLVRGIMRAALTPSSVRERFEIRTRSAVASVRGTEWIVEATGADTAVFVMRGRVAVAATGGGSAVLLEPGFGTDVLDSRAPDMPKKWGAQRAARVTELTELR